MCFRCLIQYFGHESKPFLLFSARGTGLLTRGAGALCSGGGRQALAPRGTLSGGGAGGRPGSDGRRCRGCRGGTSQRPLGTRSTHLTLQYRRRIKEIRGQVGNTAGGNPSPSYPRLPPNAMERLNLMSIKVEEISFIPTGMEILLIPPRGGRDTSLWNKTRSL